MAPPPPPPPKLAPSKPMPAPCVGFAAQSPAADATAAKNASTSVSLYRGDVWSSLHAAHLTVQQQMHRQFVASVERAANDEHQRIDVEYKRTISDLDQKLQSATAAFKQVHAGLHADMKKAKDRHTTQFDEVQAKSSSFIARYGSIHSNGNRLMTSITTTNVDAATTNVAAATTNVAAATTNVAAATTNVAAATKTTIMADWGPPSKYYRRSPTFEQWCERTLQMQPQTVIATTIDLLCRALAIAGKRAPIDVLATITPEFLARHRLSIALIAGAPGLTTTTTTSTTTTTTAENHQAAAPLTDADGSAPQPSISAFFGDNSENKASDDRVVVNSFDKDEVEYGVTSSNGDYDASEARFVDYGTEQAEPFIAARRASRTRRRLANSSP
jgi:hypothetical protein